MALLSDDYLINPLCKRTMAHGWKCGEMGYCSDECMVIGSFKCGAAALGGLMAMAVAIGHTHCGYRRTRMIKLVPARPISFDDEEPSGQSVADWYEEFRGVKRNGE